MTFRSVLLAAMVLAVSAAAAPAGDGVPQSREAIWRSIFARPPAGPAHGDTAAATAREALGAQLFRDTRLSANERRACASCHDPERAFTDGLERGAALDGSSLMRNTPSLYDVGWNEHFFWDGRARSLEEQARGPLTAADEMAGRFDEIVPKLERDPRMREAFARAFPGSPAITEDAILAALAAYERTIASPETRFDDWIAGDGEALSALEQQGFDLFVGKAGCVGCHGGWRFTDGGFHDIGRPGPDPGRGAVLGGVPGLAQFKTPSLRELAHTAPYMHDGSLPTLAAVVDHYAGGFERRASIDSNIVRDLVLSNEEKEALIAFLLSLSSAPAAKPAK